MNKLIGYLWFAFKVILQVGIAALTLSVANTAFEAVTIAGLILIYAAVRAGVISLHQSAVGLDVVAHRRFNYLAAQMSHPEMAEFVQSLKVSVDFQNQLARKTMAEMIALSLMSLIAISAIVLRAL